MTSETALHTLCTDMTIDETKQSGTGVEKAGSAHEPPAEEASVSLGSPSGNVEPAQDGASSLSPDVVESCEHTLVSIGTSSRWRIVLPVVALAAWLFGVYWRYQHIFFTRLATKYISSDMRAYVRRAKQLYDPSYHENITDSLFPPGTHYWFGYLYHLDPSWGLAQWGQCVISSLVPLLLLGIAWDLYGRRAGLLALIISSLYFPFVDYFSYFLSEGPFLFTILLGMWLTIRVIKTRCIWAGAPLAILAGLIIGIACSIRGVALLPVGFVGVALVIAAIKHGSGKLGLKLVLMAVGTIFVLVPLAQRCTQLNEDRFCLVSTNDGMNMLLGHYKDVRGITWKDKKRGYSLVFKTPVNKQRGYKTKYTFEFGAYDQQANREKVWEYFTEQPVDSLLLGVDHVVDLFTGTVPWPQIATPSKRKMITYQHLFLLFLLFPALMHVVTSWRSWKELDGPALGDLICVLCLVGLMITAFIAHGSPRIRMPFDGFIMLLAIRIYLGGRVEGAGIRLGTL